MRQIIRILLDNALTHTPEGTSVTVTTYSVNQRAELTVSDDGPGIPQRVQGRIFERFYTADSSGGSGLGLAIARELAQRMDGRISITSSRRFTAFTLDLPPVPQGALERRGESHESNCVSRRAAARVVPAALLAALLAGCGGSAGGSSTSAAAEATKTTTQVVVQTAESGFDAPRVYREASPGVVTIRSIFDSGGAEGSGFVLDTAGHIVTNAHVVTDGEGGNRKEAKAVYVEFPNRNVLRPRSSASTPSPTSPCWKFDLARLRTAPAEARRRRRTGGRPAGGGDRQPVRRGSSRSRSASSRRSTARSAR